MEIEEVAMEVAEKNTSPLNNKCNIFIHHLFLESDDKLISNPNY